MWYLYLIKHSDTKELYIGVTNDLQKRLKEHNKGNNFSTRRKIGKWRYIYVEAYRSKKDAFDREKKLKYHGSTMRELKKRIKNSLTMD